MIRKLRQALDDLHAIRVLLEDRQHARDRAATRLIEALACGADLTPDEIRERVQAGRMTPNAARDADLARGVARSSATSATAADMADAICTHCGEVPAPMTYDGGRVCDLCFDLLWQLYVDDEAERAERDALAAEEG